MRLYCGGLVIKLCLTLATPWTVSHQALLSLGFPRQKYWSGMPFPFPGDLPDPGIKPTSPTLQAVSCIASEFFTAESPGSKILTAEMQEGDEVTQHHLWEINQGL